MGNANSCCLYASHRGGGSRRDDQNDGKRARKRGTGNCLNGGHGGGSGGGPEAHLYPGDENGGGGGESIHASLSVPASDGGPKSKEDSSCNLQHISEREPDDWEEDPSLHPTTETMFMAKSSQSECSLLCRVTGDRDSTYCTVGAGSKRCGKCAA